MSARSLEFHHGKHRKACVLNTLILPDGCAEVSNRPAGDQRGIL